MKRPERKDFAIILSADTGGLAKYCNAQNKYIDHLEAEGRQKTNHIHALLVVIEEMSLGIKGQEKDWQDIINDAQETLAK